MAAALAYAVEGLKTLSLRGRTAAEIAKALDEQRPRVVLVYDLGGGTFDVTVLRIDRSDLTVLATAGDVRLGGKDWDERLFDHMADAFTRAHGEDPRDSPQSLANLMLEAEETKKVLSARKKAGYAVHYAGKTFTAEVTREQFNAMTEDLLYRSESRVKRVVKAAGVAWDKVDEVLLVGGSSRMPQVREMLRRVSGREPNCSLSPDEAVAHGAAIHAAVCTVKRAEAKAAKAQGKRHKPPVPGSAAAPAGVSDNTDHGDDGDHGDDARHPGWLNYFAGGVVRFLRAIRTTNVNAHGLGVISKGEHRGQYVTLLIPPNTPLPVSVTKRFGTAADNQRSVTVKVVEGESDDPDECILVGACTIAPLPSGLPRNSPIGITFTYDAGGRLHVEAVEESSGNWASVSIERKAGIPHGQMDLDARQRVAQAVVS